MNVFVDKLLDLEKQAGELVEQARQYRDQVRREIQTEKDRLLDQYTRRAETRIEVVREGEADGLEDYLQRLREKTDSLRSAMNQTYESRREDWIARICERSVGG